MRERRVDHHRHGWIISAISRYNLTRFVKELLPFVGELQTGSFGHDKVVYAPGGRVRESGVTERRFFLPTTKTGVTIPVVAGPNRCETMHPEGIGTPKGCIDPVE